MKKYFFAFILGVLLTACSVEPQPIKYGTDMCEFCRMAISEPKFATEFITKKGKVYKFDCIECMIHFIKANNIERNSLSHLLVNRYLIQNGFLDANKAFFLKSESLPSPMGEGLSAFTSLEEIQQMQNQHAGQSYSWSQLMEIIN